MVEFGWTNPILIDENAGILAGHGRLLAARKLGLSEVPVIRFEHLSEAQKRAYLIADNQLALQAGWGEALLAEELVAAGRAFDLTAPIASRRALCRECRGTAHTEIDFDLDNASPAPGVIKKKCHDIRRKIEDELRAQAGRGPAVARWVMLHCAVQPTADLHPPAGADQGQAHL